MWVRDRLDGLWHDEDFDDWYPRDGRPGLSPAQLATVSMLQFLLNLSDRQAAEAVRCRIDPRRLHEFQARNRADQQDPQWQRLYASRSGVEGTMNELVNGHRMRRCRYHGVAKAHVQHVLTAIAVTIERFSAQEPADATYRPRSPTAFQRYLVDNELPRPRWWRQGQ
ncbi:transposase [Streptomyces sp. NWU339]|uniref:transposase n=1 Tax=Streptomyces sp. NWU339 TaxID=2185284 RepID=UPI00215A8124|nr:transposase [Streptomyces sp. NWU339]